MQVFLFFFLFAHGMMMMIRERGDRDVGRNQIESGFFFSLVPSFYVRVAMLRLPLEGLTFPSYFETRSELSLSPVRALPLTSYLLTTGPPQSVSVHRESNLEESKSTKLHASICSSLRPSEFTDVPGSRSTDHVVYSNQCPGRSARTYAAFPLSQSGSEDPNPGI